MSHVWIVNSAVTYWLIISDFSYIINDTYSLIKIYYKQYF